MTTDITVTSNTFSTNRRANIGTNSHQPATSNPTATASATTKATVAATLLKHQQKSDDTDVGLRPVTDAGKGSGDLIAQSADLHAELNEGLLAQLAKKQQLKREKQRWKNKMKREKKKQGNDKVTGQEQKDVYTLESSDIIVVKLPKPTDAHISDTGNTASSSSSSSSLNPAPVFVESTNRPQKSPTNKIMMTYSAENDLDEGDDWTAGEDEDDSRPPVHALKQLMSAKQSKKGLPKKDAPKPKSIFEVPAFPTFSQPRQGELPIYKFGDNLHELVEPSKLVHKSAFLATKTQHKTMSPVRTANSSWVPPAFASTAPQDLLELYNEDDSHSYYNRKTRTYAVCMRVSLTPLPGLAILPVMGPQRRKLRASLGVVSISLVLKSRWSRLNDEFVKPSKEWSTREGAQVNIEPRKSFILQEETISANIQDIKRPSSVVQLTPRVSSATAGPSSFVSALEVGDALSTTASTAASTSVPTPPIPKHAAETTFYTSAPSHDANPVFVEANEDARGFIPASTATITAPKPQIPFLPSASIATSTEPHSIPLHSYVHPLQLPAQRLLPGQGGEEYPTGANYSQPFHAPDGSMWTLSEYRQPVPYHDYLPMQQQHQQPYQQPYFSQHSSLPTNPKGTAARKYIRSNVTQPYDSPPYSPHESFPHNQHQFAGPFLSYPLSASSSMQNPALINPALFQPHPLSLPPQMAPLPLTHPQHQHQHQLLQPSMLYEGYSYDPGTGLITDQSGLVFPQQYHGHVRSLDEYNYAMHGMPTDVMQPYMGAVNGVEGNEYQDQQHY